MAGGGEPIAAHAAVVAVFVGRFAVRSQADDHIAGAEINFQHLFAFHPGKGGIADVHGAHDIPYIRRFAACEVDVDTIRLHRIRKHSGGLDQGGDHLPRYQAFVAADRGGEHKRIRTPHTSHIVEVHDNGILGHPGPYAEVAALFPVQVGQARFGTCRIGVHEVAVRRVQRGIIGDYLTESIGEQAFVEAFYRLVHFFFGSGNPALVVS